MSMWEPNILARETSKSCQGLADTLGLSRPKDGVIVHRSAMGCSIGGVGVLSSYSPHP
jgi:hypothetical protein